MLPNSFISCAGLFIPSGNGIGTTPANNPATSALSTSWNRSAITEVNASFTDFATGLANFTHAPKVSFTQSARDSIAGVPGAGLNLQVISSHKFAWLSARRAASATSALTLP